MGNKGQLGGVGDGALEWFAITGRPVLASALCAPARTGAEEGAPA